MQGVIQLVHRVLQNGLCLCSGALQHCKLLIQQPLPKALLLRLLMGKRQRLQTTEGPGLSSKDWQWTVGQGSLTVSMKEALV